MKCPGCGVRLQSEDTRLPGYVPAESRERGTDVLCRRCFRLRHYGKVEAAGLAADEYVTLVKQAVGQADGLLVVIDIIDFEGSFDESLLAICREKPFAVAINKMDLLPEVVPKQEIQDWVYQRFEARGLYPEDCIGISSKRQEGIKTMWQNVIMHLGQRVAVVGVTNVGKSTLLSAALKLYGKTKVSEPTVSDVAGTTLGITEFSLQRNVVLVDTPGLIPAGRLSDIVCEDCQRVLVPNRPLASKLMEIAAGDSLLLSKYCQIDVVSVTGDAQDPDKALLAAFVPGDIRVHKTNTKRALELRQQAKSELFVSPCGQCSADLSALPWETTEMEVDPGRDVAISGLGWLAVRKGSVTLAIGLPAGIKATKRVNLVGKKDVMSWV